jgi:hypothetical protein
MKKIVFLKTFTVQNKKAANYLKIFLFSQKKIYIVNYKIVNLKINL